ncbi:MAG: polysaccharide deacetylase family protein [Candidatus Brocadiia bacterium]
MKRLARRALAALAVGTRLWPLVPRGQAAVLRYHRVAPSGARPLPLAVPEREFAAQLRFLRSRCRVVGAREVAEAVVEERRLPPRAVAITFDDGYADNASVALPLLRRYGLPATFFVTTGWVGTERLQWWDRLHQHVAQAAASGYPPAGHEELPRPVADALGAARLGTPGAGPALERSLVAALRGLELSPEELDRTLERIAAALGVDEPEPQDYLPMSWDQVRELRDGGMEVGSHTVSHACLTAVPAQRAHEELSDSKAALERELGEPVALLAYPAGDYDQDVADLAVEAGYQAAFTTTAGAVAAGDHAFGLRRIGVWAGGYRGAVARFAPSVFGLQIGRLARRA